MNWPSLLRKGFAFTNFECERAFARAGLIEVDRTDRGHVSERLAKAAPKLHGKKVDPSVIKRAKINAYYRYIQVALARAK